MLGFVKINNYEIGLRFKNDKLQKVLKPGWYFENTILGERIDKLSEKNIFCYHKDIDELLRLKALDEYIQVVDLKDDERAALWLDGRFLQLLMPGKYALFNRFREIKAERFSVADPQFKHRFLKQILSSAGSQISLLHVQVEQGESCLFFKNGRFEAELKPGSYGFWKNAANLRFYNMNLREQILDISGQDIITSDKVSIRVNAVIAFKIVDSLKAFNVTEKPEELLYREGQLVLRSVVGAKKLDELLANKNILSQEIVNLLKKQAEKFGMSVVNFGIKDIILPGEMRELMNKVVEAQKEAEAIQIARREETAATRSQCNTAKMLERNPTLMRLHELEVLERISKNSKLNLVLGEKGLTEKIVNLL